MAFSYSIVDGQDSLDSAINQRDIKTKDSSIFLRTRSLQTWEEAEAQAASLGGHLASIHSETKQKWIETNFLRRPEGAQFPLEGGMWLGLNDKDLDGKWQWSDGTDYQYGNWSEGQNKDSAHLSPQADMYVSAMSSDSNAINGLWGDLSPKAKRQALFEIPFATHRNSAYVLVQGQTWNDAQANAKQLGGNLVTINDASEDKFLTSWLGSQAEKLGSATEMTKSDGCSSQMDFPNLALSKLPSGHLHGSPFTLMKTGEAEEGVMGRRFLTKQKTQSDLEKWRGKAPIEEQQALTTPGMKESGIGQSSLPTTSIT